MSFNLCVFRLRFFVYLILLICPGTFASGLSQANNSWVLASTALVLFMVIPGLSLFYGSLVRTKNVLSVLMQCFSVCCLASLLWLLVGSSLAFGDGGTSNWFLVDLDNFLMSKIAEDSLSGDISESVFAMIRVTLPL